MILTLRSNQVVAMQVECLWALLSICVYQLKRLYISNNYFDPGYRIRRRTRPGFNICKLQEIYTKLIRIIISANVFFSCVTFNFDPVKAMLVPRFFVFGCQQRSIKYIKSSLIWEVSSSFIERFEAAYIRYSRAISLRTGMCIAQNVSSLQKVSTPWSLNLFKRILNLRLLSSVDYRLDRTPSSLDNSLDTSPERKYGTIWPLQSVLGLFVEFSNYNSLFKPDSLTFRLTFWMLFHLLHRYVSRKTPYRHWLYIVQIIDSWIYPVCF